MKNPIAPLKVFAILLILGWSIDDARTAEALAIVVPNGFETAEGNSWPMFPFVTITPLRYQQVYDASQFGNAGVGGFWITSLEFREDVNYHGLFAVISNLQVNLSTTSKRPDKLSQVFAENVGADDKIVFGPVYYWAGPINAGAWQVGLRLAVPFFYDPTKGNLLLDVRNYTGTRNGGSGALDGVDKSGDSISEVFGTVNSTFGDLYTLGLITRFSIQPAPPRPTLLVEQSGSGVVIRWPTTATNFVLEATSAIAASNHWVDITNIPIVASSENIVTNRSVGTNQFFRLRYKMN